MATMTDLSSLSRSTPCFVRNPMELSEYSDQMGKKIMSLDLPGITWANEDHDTETSPSKRKVTNEPERTPCGTAPNSAKKRRPRHALSRATPTPSHGVKMSGIFQDAAASLEACYTSPTTLSPNMKNLRMPIRHARMNPFGHKGGQERFASPQVADSAKLESPPASALSRAPTPPAIPYGLEFPTPLPTRLSSCESPTKLVSSSDQAIKSCGNNLARQIIGDRREDARTGIVNYPKLNQWKMRRFSSVPSSLSSDCHSTHGVPVVIPIPSASHDNVEVIDSWLSAVYEPDTAKSPVDKPYTPQSPDHKPYTPQSPDHGSYAPQSPDHGSYAPQSPDHRSYAPQSPDHRSYAPQSPDHWAYAPQSPGADFQDSTSRQDFNFKRSPKRPFTALRPFPNPLLMLSNKANIGMPMSASSSNKENSHPAYPTLSFTDSIPPPSIYHCSTPSPSPKCSHLPSQSFYSFPMCTPLLPSASSGRPTSLNPIPAFGPRIPSTTGNPRRKRMRVRSRSDIPIYARSVRRLTRQVTSSNEDEGAPVKELSPHVERYRKGYGPQPERRPSYWDRDILGIRANGEGDGEFGDDGATMGENYKKRDFQESIGDGRKVMSEDLRRVEEGVENARSGLRA